ncbi:MAG: hypothetical protein LBN11_06955 [Tannerella sp.]|jgi:hypothetical protein|nr:hypothetical protein [Tannerella sp.]
MKTEILQGTEKRLYDIVGPLAMTQAVLRQNDNVAFKTSERHTYFIALDDDDACTGFISVQKKGNIGEINNYYIKDRDTDVMKALLKLAEKHAKKEELGALTIITQSKDYAVVEKLKYSPEKTFVKYTRFSKKL